MKNDWTKHVGWLRGTLLRVVSRGVFISCLFVTARCAVAAEGNVEISHATLADGSVEFQIRGVTERPSALGLYEIRTNMEMARISSFHFSENGGIYIARLPAGNPEGVYEIRLYGGDGEEIVFPRLPVSPPRGTLEGISTVLDRRKSVVSWVPNQTSLLRVNAGFDGGMFIRTLVPWHFSAAVKCSVPWDFWDEDHVADYRNARGLRVYARAIPLPSHLVVLGQPLFNVYTNLPLFADLNMLDPEFGFAVTVDGDQVHEVDFLPGKKVAEISPGSAIRIQLDQAGKEILASKRYEILFFMNGQFFYEESDAADPYTFIWPSEEMGEGFQVLTVNVSSYNIGYGSKTIPIWLSRTNRLQSTQEARNDN